jgi:hypothetical protein
MWQQPAVAGHGPATSKWPADDEGMSVEPSALLSMMQDQLVARAALVCKSFAVGLVHSACVVPQWLSSQIWQVCRLLQLDSAEAAMLLQVYHTV